MSKPAISVIIPTYNRLDALKLCLRALEEQTHRDFEVIVVNDGATDGTADYLQRYCASTHLRMNVFDQENAGPARARNVAIQAAEADISLLIGDDILATPTFVEQHLAFQRENPQLDQFALGLTVWDTVHQHISPFMRWYESIQFDYHFLLAGAQVDWHHTYTSNLSFKTQVLRDHPFDERFRFAAWEDIELGYRLQQNGMFHITFLKDVIGRHVHPTTFRRAVARSRTVGRMERLLHRVHPELNQAPRPAKLGGKVTAFLARHEWLLNSAAACVDWLPVTGKPQQLIINASQKFGYANGSDRL